jgi:hypothetical protein
VFRIAGTPDTVEARLVAACFAGGLGAYASVRSAAMLWGLPGGSRSVVEITCPRWRRARHDGLIVHEWFGALDAGDVVARAGIPVASVELTLLTLGSSVPEPVVEQAVDVAVNRSLTTFPSLRGTLERLAKRGRSGCATLRTILDVRAPVSGTPESPAETTLLRILVGSGLPIPELQYEVCDGRALVARVDAAYPDHRVALEYESYEHHTGRAALVRDSARRNRLARLGWTVVAVTAEDLRGGGHLVIGTIRDLLGRAP